MGVLHPRLRRLAADTLDLVLPPRCPGCADDVAAHALLCSACFAQVSFITEPLCERCGVPFAAAAQGPLCVACQDVPPRFGQARAALRYDDGARRLVLPLKHADRVELAAVLSPWMARTGAALLARAEVIVPVPLHPARLRRRRYNQAALLARHLARIAGRPAVLDGLQRVRGTAALGGKTAAERSAELDGAFRVRPARKAVLRGRSVLLIDDVITSGATGNACAAALLEEGAARVDMLAAARVPDPRLR